MDNNFINKETGKEFLVLNSTSRYIGGEMQYFDKDGKRLIDSGVVLSKIPKNLDGGSPGIRTPTRNRL